MDKNFHSLFIKLYNAIQEQGKIIKNIDNGSNIKPTKKNIIFVIIPFPYLQGNKNIKNI